MFSGYKTYIVAGVAIISAAAGYLTGDMSISQAAQIVVTAVLGMTIRHGITAEANK